VLLLRIVKPAQVADIVEQRADRAKLEQAFVHDLRTGGLYTAVHQSRHRQRDLQDVLNVMVPGLAGVIAWKLSAIQATDVGEHPQHTDGNSRR